jgi:hypothetical protein
MIKDRLKSLTKRLPLVLAVFLIASMLISIFPQKVGATGWLTGYTYRKSVTITNQIADYQTKITVGYNAGGDVHCTGHCAIDFTDVRFTKSDGTTELDYWIESYTASTSAVIWVQNSNPAQTTCYMYYGHAAEATTSNGTNTFLFFDHFTAAWPDGLWTGDTANGSTSGGILTWTGGTGVKAIYAAAQTGDIALRARASMQDADLTELFLAKSDLSNYLNLVRYSGAAANNTQWATSDTGSDTVVSNTAGGFGAYHIYDLCRNLTTTPTVKFYKDDGLIASGTSHVAAGDLSAMFRTGNAVTILSDWILIRKYALTEPSFGSWGTEEGLPTVTTSAASVVVNTSATLNGNITATGGDNCTEKGFVWGTVSRADPGDVTPPASYSDNYTYYGNYGIEAIIHATGAVLVAGTPYYYRAFARNPAGWAYGGEVTFTTLGPPTVTVSAATDVEETSATLHGNITALNGNASCDSRGFEWSVDMGYGSSWTESAGGYGTGIYSGVTGVTLLPGTLYNVRAKATGNLYGTGYSSGLTFLTKPEAPTGLGITVTSSTQLTLAWC